MNKFQTTNVTPNCNHISQITTTTTVNVSKQLVSNKKLQKSSWSLDGKITEVTYLCFSTNFTFLYAMAMK